MDHVEFSSRGGHARAAKLSPARRREIARKAAAAASAKRTAAAQARKLARSGAGK